MPAGGPALFGICLSEDMFEAAAMAAVDKDLMAMKVDELKEELEARVARQSRATRRGCGGGCTRRSCVCTSPSRRVRVIRGPIFMPIFSRARATFNFVCRLRDF